MRIPWTRNAIDNIISIFRKFRYNQIEIEIIVTRSIVNRKLMNPCDVLRLNAVIIH